MCVISDPDPSVSITKSSIPIGPCLCIAGMFSNSSASSVEKKEGRETGLAVSERDGRNG